MRADVDKRKQTLKPPFIAVFYTPLCNPLNVKQILPADVLAISESAVKIASERRCGIFGALESRPPKIEKQSRDAALNNSRCNP